MTRMAGFTLGALLAFSVGTLAVSFMPGSILGVIQDLGVLGLAVSLCYYVGIGGKWLLRKVFWKVRNRIIVAFAFAGIFPVLLLAAIAFSVIGLILMRVAGFFLEAEMREVSTQIERVGTSISRQYLEQRRAGENAAALLSGVAEARLRDVPVGYEKLRIEVHSREDSAQEVSELPRFSVVNELSRRSTGVPSLGADAPSWLEDGFADLTLIGEELRFTRVVEIESGLRIVLLLPFDEAIATMIRDRTSMEVLITDQNPSTMTEGFLSVFSDFRERQALLALNWSHVFRPVEWETGAPSPEPWLVLISMPPQTLLLQFFAKSASVLLTFIVILAGGLVLVELISFAVGIFIARRVTGSIHDIYAGTERIQAGDFSFRIPSRNKDQLDAMANSFNEMSSSITDLMEQVSLREALEKELEIAKEVQAQLFPPSLPEVGGLEIAASCHAARQVSGDYYDFLSRKGRGLDVVVGDISGKGISAALLMASTQATIRSGLMDGGGDGDQPSRMARVVKEVNKQLYRRSSPELYSTLVLAHYDSESRLLSYCNAGHHPPLVFSNGSVSSLTIGGTVVGLFENWNYDGGQHQLQKGDLVVFFTDGVVEAADPEGEQLGTERVVETVSSNTFLTADDIQSLILEQVFAWSKGMEQGDDITVVCLKVMD